MSENTLFNQANSLSEEGKFELAHEIYLSIIDSTTEKHVVYNNIAINAKKWGNKSLALEYVQKAVDYKEDYVSGNMCLFETSAYFDDYSKLPYQEFSFGDDVLFHPDFKISKEKRLDFFEHFTNLALRTRFKVEDSFNVESYETILGKVQDKRINVISSQGLGDVIQCSQYILRLLSYNPRQIIVSVRPELIRVLWELTYIDKRIKIIDYRAFEEDYDYFIPIFSLMKIFKDTNSPKARWLGVEERDSFFARSILKKELKNLSNGRIGIVWRGNPNHSNDKNRSLTLKKLLKLLPNLENKSLVSLQFDVTSTEKEILKEHNIVDLSPYIKDLYDMSCFMVHLDLFVSVDSAPIHLAGATGVNSLCLIPKGHEDWRWGFEGNHKNYSSVKIIRF